jgi:photosystem II stability/assembly factor-like uncharacterized protein
MYRIPKIEILILRNALINRSSWLILCLILFFCSIGLAFTAEWTYLGLSDEVVKSILINHDSTEILFIGTARYYMHPGLGGVFTSTNGGSSWDTTGLWGRDVVDLTFHPTNLNILYAACYTSDGSTPGVYKTTDGGHTWFWSSNGIPLLPSVTGVQSIAVHPKGPDTLLAGTGGPMGGGLYKSTDNGENWAELLGFRIKLITFDMKNPRIIYVMIEGEGLTKSIDSGQSWFPILSGSAVQIIMSFTIDCLSSNFLYVGTYGRGLFKSIDAGTTWAAINKGLPDSLDNLKVQSMVIDSSNPNIIYAGTGREGIFKSENAGLTWSKLHPEIPDQHVNTLALDYDRDKTLYAGTDNGIWRLDMTTDVDYDHDKDIESPRKYMLYQNYPNPFNSTTCIRFNIPSREMSGDSRLCVLCPTLKIYNILGQKVRTLVDAFREPGYYAVTWDGRDEKGQIAPTGIYFYRLSGNGFTSIRKMVLLR